MRKGSILAVLGMAVLGWLSAAPASAISIDEMIELCNAGYSTGDILEIAETLGLDEPLEYDDLVRLKEEGCEGDLAVALLQVYETEEEIEEDYSAGYYDSPASVYIHAGWGYPYYGYGNWWGNRWYASGWGVHYGWYDPWYWDSWYWGDYYYPRHHWARWYYHPHHHWRYDRDYRWCRSDYRYRYVTAHEKIKKSRAGRTYGEKAYRKDRNNRAALSRSLVSKSYETRRGDKTRITAYKKSTTPRQSKSEYYVKDRKTTRAKSTAIKKTKRNKSTTSIKVRRKSESGKTIKSTKKRRSSSGTYKRSTGSSRTPSSRSVGKRTYRTSGSSGTRRTTSTAKRSGSSSGSKSSGRSGYSAPAPSSSKSSSSSTSSSTRSRTRRR